MNAEFRQVTPFVALMSAFEHPLIKSPVPPRTSRLVQDLCTGRLCLIYLYIPTYIRMLSEGFQPKYVYIRIPCCGAVADIEIQVAEPVLDSTVFPLGVWADHAQYYPSLVRTD